MDRPKGLSRRARRAMPLIAAALTAIAVAGVIYLHPAVLPAPAKPAAKVTRPLLLSNQYSATYDFVTPSVGWALVVGRVTGSANFSVYSTSDAAKHWSRQLAASSATDGLSWIEFFDRAHGVIAFGSPSVLYRTGDGGVHWELRQVPGNALSSISFSDPLHGWMISVSDPSSGFANHYFVTVDGGTSWSERTLPSWAVGINKGGAGEMQFRRPADGWLGANGDLPTVYSSIDGGASWQPHALPVPPPSVPAGKPLPPPGVNAVNTTVVLLPQVGVMAIVDDYLGRLAYTSFDGGSTWRTLATPPGETTFTDFAYQDAFHWWAMRFGTLWKTSDAGQSWKQVSQQTDDWDYRPQVIDAKNAVALLVGSPGNQVAGSGLATTSDGGLHWKQVDAPQPG